MSSDFRQNGDNHEQLNIYYTSIIVKTGNKYNKFSKKTNQITLNFTTCTDKKKQYFFTKNLRFQKISLPLQSHFGKVHSKQAEIAQLVEHDLAKVGVASSSLVFRSRGSPKKFGGPRFYITSLELATPQSPYSSTFGKNVHEFCVEPKLFFPNLFLAEKSKRFQFTQILFCGIYTSNLA